MHDWIDITDVDMDETREVKVRLPVHQLMRLHGLKLMRGQSLSSTVQSALDAWFAAAEAAEKDGSRRE
ncbi:MAG: hypothetical protein KY455_02800 [Euryarchaeota archaeon]|nr:hypothetical protein [Euryarchaeota archaeon]